MSERARCPSCGRPVRPLDRERREGRGRGFFPFCSERCRAVDLGRFLDEEYRFSEPLLPRPGEIEEP